MTSSPTRLARYLPGSPTERAAMLSQAARDDEARGFLQSAETNLRLTLCFLPGDEAVKAAPTLLGARPERERVAAL